MEMALAVVLMSFSIGIMAYLISHRKLVEEVHLPSEIGDELGSGLKRFNVKNTSGPARIVEYLISKFKIPSPMENLQKRLASSDKVISVSLFIAIKIILTVAGPVIAFIFFQAATPVLIFVMGIGFILPDIWLDKNIKKRRALILKDLPLVIDLLNICVGAGLDFMVAVNRVTQEFRPCAIIEELKIMTRDIQMGSFRRDALKNMAARINSPEVSSFVRTLLQADRIGTPISDALKMQSEEIRTRWFQRGEEMALKAPIKLLLPLMLFILPVVLIVVAGPILIQFTRGGGIVKF
ncbi:MAG: type II secretion system F family protein [Candidatus Omnitrophota bacterium]